MPLKKVAWKSKSVWLGVIAAAYGLLNIFFQVPFPQEQILGYVVAGWGTLAVILRFVSKDQIILTE